MSVSGDAVQSLVEYARLFHGKPRDPRFNIWTSCENEIIEDLILTGYLTVEPNGLMKKVNN